MAKTIEIQNVDPTTLLVDINVRADLALTKEFIGSIKEHGVLVPIVAIHTDDGLRVRMGHRRTMAAVEAGRDTIPVYIIGTDAQGDDAEIERLLTQHAENHHRAGLSVTDDANVAQQLSLLGLSISQIAKRTQTKKTHVQTALTVAGSELASKATDRYDLTLDQAAVLAEFENDTDTVTALVAAVQTGQFDHAAQKARSDRDDAQAQAPLITDLTKAGITVIERPTWSDQATALDTLVDSSGTPIDPESHTACEGHAAFLIEEETYVEPDGTILDADRWGNVNWPEDNEPATDEEAEERWTKVCVRADWTPAYACTDPAAHAHLTRSQYYEQSSKHRPAAEKSDTEREADKQKRALVIANNKAWKAAREVRNEWVKTYLTRKTLPAHAGTFIAVAMSGDVDLIAGNSANHQAATWLIGEDSESYGYNANLTKTANEANDKRGLVIALGITLAGYEKRAGDGAWRENGDHSPTGRYLRYLAECGYTLSDVEKYAESSETA